MFHLKVLKEFQELSQELFKVQEQLAMMQDL